MLFLLLCVGSVHGGVGDLFATPTLARSPGEENSSLETSLGTPFSRCQPMQVRTRNFVKVGGGFVDSFVVFCEQMRADVGIVRVGGVRQMEHMWRVARTVSENRQEGEMT